MRKENTKKSKLGLIVAICLVAVLAVGGVLLAVLGFGSGQQGAATGPVKLYWNVDRDLYWGKSATGFSSREPGTDGVYRIKFAVDGQQVEIPVTDKTLVNAIDSMEVMVLTLDRDGNVIDVQEAKNVIKHSVIKSYVQDVSGDTINANSVILMNGMRHRIKVTEKTKIYDMSGDAEFVGQEVKPETLSFLDCIHMFVNEATEEQTVFVLSHMEERKLFYRVEQKWDFAEEGTLRQPDADGAYTLEVFHEGEYVELKTKDKDIADLFDYKSPYSPHFCFGFDDDGYIISIENSEVGKFGIMSAQRVEVLEVDGNKVMAMETIQGSQGRAYNMTIPADCVIYDASNVAKVEGRHGQPVDSLKLRDIINVWTDVNGNPKFIYISQRMADSPAYWTFKQQYDGTKKETTRKPVKGWYEFELAEAGKGGTKIYKTKDKALANKIDATVERVVGLKLNGNIIEGVYAPEDLFGYSIIGRGSAVRDINSIFVNLIGFAHPDNPTQVMMGESCKVYDVSGVGKIGTETELKVGDHVYSFRDLTGQVVAIFVTQRSLGGNTLYYNLDYQYDSATGETKRQPNEKGYYEFLMAHKGKQVTVKTKDKAIANKIDAVGSLMMSLVIKNGVVTNVFTGDWAYNQIISSAHEVKKVNSDGSLLLAYGENEITVKPTKNTAIYNVSYVYDKYRGEKTTKFKVGDMLGVIADMYGEPQVIYIRHRMVDHMYYRMTAMLDEDGDGWYTGQFLCDGKVLNLRTQDKTIVQQINDYAAPMGLALKGDVIRGYLVPTQVKGVPYAGYNSWDVSEVDGRKVTVTYRLPGHEYTGVSEKLTLAKNCKIYDVSPTAEKYGAETTLKPGDRIRGYMDKDKNHAIIYVTYRANRAAGMESICDHCGKKVYWNPWDGGTFKQVNGHYYLNTDVTVHSQAAVGGKDIKEYEIVLDLNGKTITSENARAFLVYYGSTLTILDTVGTGAMEATGITGGHGGIGLISSGTLNLLGGTLRHIPSNQVVTSAGGLMVENSTFNMYGGVVEGGNAQKGELSDGLGGNIYGHNGVINLYGGTVRGGKATTYGGNIYSYNTIFNMYDGSVENGEAGTYGGNLFCANVTKNNFYGGVMTGGKTNGRDGNMYIYNDQATILLGDVTIDGDMYVGQTPITVAGKPVIKKGAADGLTLLAGAKLIVQEIKEGTELYINANGVISDPTDQAEKILGAGYIKPVMAGMIVDQEDGALVMKEQVILADCEHCNQQQVKWKVWNGNSAPASGHYFLAEDITRTSQTNIAAETDVVLDLKGYDITVNGSRAFAVLGGGNLTVMDTVGDGVVSATGFTGGHGGVAMVDGKLTLRGGTLKMIESDAVVCNGGALILGAPTAVLDMYGGVIEGGHAQKGDLSNGLGGNIYCYGATINLYGGTIRGGKATTYGGNIYCANASKVNLYGGTITGGITDGNDGNIFILNDQATFLLGNVTIDGGVYVGQATITVNGKPVIGKGTANGLTLDYGAKLDIQDMQAGAEVYINATGTISDPTDKAAEIIAAEYIKPVHGGMILDQDNGALIVRQQGTSGDCEHCSQQVEWMVWTGDNNPTSGHYYLADDMDRTAQTAIAAGTDVVLDLKGYDITVNGSRAFVVLTGGNLTVMDTVGDGIVSATGFTGGHGGVASVDGKLTLRGGTLKMIESDAVVCNGGTVMLGAPTAALDMYGGVIEGGHAQKGDLSNGFGGNIYSYGATINLYGGTIRGGKATTYGGNIYCANASKVNLYGGTITGGQTNGNDGNIFILNDQATFLLGDVTIDGGVYVGQATITINGKPVIQKDTANGLTLDYGAKLDIQEMKAGTELYINASGVISNTTDKADEIIAAGYIKPVRNDQMVTNNGGALNVGPLPNCDHCNQYVSWEAWDGTGNLATGHYYLTGDVTREAQIRIPADNNVVLDLKGFDITAPASRAFLVVGNLTIMDTVGDGIISATGFTGGHGGVASVDGSLTLLGGTLKMIESNAVVCNGGVLIFSAGTTFDMRGGVIEGGKAQKGDLSDGMGGNIYAVNATLKISGGVIRGGSAAYVGGNIAMEGSSCTLSVSDNAVIEGGIAQAGGNVSLFTATTLNMTGGTIRNGQSNYSNGTLGGGGNIFAASAIVNISAGTVENGTAPTLQGGNIFMRYADAVLNLSGTGKISGGSCKYDGGSIMVFQNAVMNMTGGTVENGEAGRNGGNIIVESATLTVTGGTISGGVVNNTTGSFGGNIYAEGASGIVNISGDAAITDGKAPAGGNIGTYMGTITMTGGTVSGGESTYATGNYGGGGNMYLLSATANISGGTVTGGKAPTLEGGNIYVRGDSGVLTVSGTAAITGGESRYDGGNILVFQWATLNVQGGTISGGTAGRNHPCVFVSTHSYANFSGGKVEAVYVVNTAAGLSVSGNAVIGNMDLTDGALVSVGEMATGAEVKITAADGPFSAVSANATTYADCFKSAVAGKKVYLQDNALYMGDE